MRVACAVLGIVLSASACFAQGEILDRGQSAVFIRGGGQFTESAGFTDIELGYSAIGWIDAGVAVTERQEKWGYYSSWGHYYSEFIDKSWTPAVFLNEHILRYGDPTYGALVLSLHQAVAWNGRSGTFEMLPGRKTQEYLDIGVQGTFKVAPSPACKVLLSFGYEQTINLGAGESHDRYRIDGTCGLGRDGMLLLLTPELRFQENLTTFGLKATLMFPMHTARKGN